MCGRGDDLIEHQDFRVFVCGQIAVTGNADFGSEDEPLAQFTGIDEPNHARRSEKTPA